VLHAAYDPFAVQQPLQQSFGIHQQHQQYNTFPQPVAVPAAAGNAPADAETLKKLKEELLQQKQQSQATGGKGGNAGGSSSKSKQSVVVREAAGVKWVDKTLSGVTLWRAVPGVIPLRLVPSGLPSAAVGADLAVVLTWQLYDAVVQQLSSAPCPQNCFPFMLC
jgi:hypothetical protein